MGGGWSQRKEGEEGVGRGTGCETGCGLQAGSDMLRVLCRAGPAAPLVLCRRDRLRPSSGARHAAVFEWGQACCGFDAGAAALVRGRMHLRFCDDGSGLARVVAAPAVAHVANISEEVLDRWQRGVYLRMRGECECEVRTMGAQGAPTRTAGGL